MLLLFDVDGTLIDTGGCGRRALTAALRRVAGVDDALEGVRLQGSTDPVILADAFRIHVGRPLDGDREWAAIIEAYLVELQAELLRSSEEYEILPGADVLPSAARADGRFAVGLATGNVERGAALKLGHGGLWPLFDFGGYGSDAGDRAELVRCGIERGQVIAEQQRGRRYATDEIFVIGDTEKDILAARAAGARSVGVLAGVAAPPRIARCGARPGRRLAAGSWPLDPAGPDAAPLMSGRSLRASRSTQTPSFLTWRGSLSSPRRGPRCRRSRAFAPATRWTPRSERTRSRSCLLGILRGNLIRSPRGVPPPRCHRNYLLFRDGVPLVVRTYPDSRGLRCCRSWPTRGASHPSAKGARSGSGRRRHRGGVASADVLRSASDACCFGGGCPAPGRS